MSNDQQGLQERIRLGILRKEESALRLFISTYGRQIRQVIGRKYGELADDEELDSAFNLAMGFVWNKIGEYDASVSTLQGWAYGIAQRIAQHGLKFNRFEIPNNLSTVDNRPTDGDEPEVVGRLLAFIDEELTNRQRHVIRADLAAGGKADDSRLAAEFRTTKRSIQSTRSQARKQIKNARTRILDEERVSNE